MTLELSGLMLLNDLSKGHSVSQIASILSIAIIACKLPMQIKRENVAEWLGHVTQNQMVWCSIHTVGHV